MILTLPPPGPYTGIGSRETPPDVLDLMTRIAWLLVERGFTLRSGAAPGADSAFERGVGAGVPKVSPRAEIYLPWPNFEERGRATGRPGCLVALERPAPEAYEIAAQYHPAWSRLSRGAQALQARNCHQVLGANLKTPSLFVVCWTPDGSTGKTTSKTGGTGQAIRIAAANEIPVFNLRRDDHRRMWEAMIGQV